MFLLGRLHLIPRDTKALAICHVQGCLPVYVPNDGGGLLDSLALQRSSGLELTHGRDVSHILSLVACKGVCASKLYLCVESASCAYPQSEESPNQVKVILNKIAFEGFQWQRSIPHRHNERVVYELMPDRGHIRAIQHPFNKAASGTWSACRPGVLGTWHSLGEWQRVGRVEVVKGAVATA